MQNIGDRLTEARKRLGLDLRQASEATKIRTDYLMAMEDGSFDFSLPEVYKKGFLKIYSRYLKLDADKLAADFMTQFSAGARREDRENLGRVDAPGSTNTAAAFENLAAEQAARAQKQAAYFRLGVFVSIAVIFIVLLIVVFQHMLNSSAATENKTAENPAPPTANSTLPANPVTTTLPASVAPSQLQFVFAASGNIGNLTIWELADQKQLSTGPLAAGKTRVVTSKGPVRVSVSETQYLTIQVNGGSAQAIAGQDGKRLVGPATVDWPPQQ